VPGRKAMPIELLLINGNKNRLTKSEIESRRKAENAIKPASNNIKPPTWLNATAKKEFKKLAAELSTVDLITNVDVNQLAIYCRTYARYIEMQKGIPELDEYGDPKLDENGNMIIVYDEKQIDILYKQLKGMAAEFGFTPSSRAKLAIKKEDDKPKSEEEKLFGDV
jgi:P27 family predicted phage terminase small subunit